jgi:hypothetical protein
MDAARRSALQVADFFGLTDMTDQLTRPAADLAGAAEGATTQ